MNTASQLPPVSSAVLHALDFPRIQAAAAARAQTGLGHQMALALAPLPSVQLAQDRLQTVGELARVAAEDQQWPSLSGVSDVTDHLRLAERGGTLEPLALRAVAATFAVGDAAARYCAARRERMPHVAALVDAFGDYDALMADIERSVEPTGRLSDDATPQLGELRRRLNGIRDGLHTRMDRLVREYADKGLLQDTFHTLREDRYVLPVKAAERWRVEGIVHDTSQTHQTFFIEPQEVIDLGNRMKAAAADVAQEEARILAVLSGAVGQRSREMAVDLDALHGLDLVAACARLAADLRAHVPRICHPDDGAPPEVALHQFRHPVLVLDAQDAGVTPQVVANDLRVGQPPVLVVTGPNTGGKTVALKGVGLCALMVRAGLPIPVGPDSRLPMYDRIHAVVGDQQSLSAALSSFGAHLGAVKEMMDGVAAAAHHHQQVLCVLDEVMSGTDPEQGAALAQAVLERLAAMGAHVVATTHFEKLKALALAEGPDGAVMFRNASVGLDARGGTPTYHLVYDTPGASSALEMATRLGMPEDVVTRARSLTSAQGQALDALVRDLGAKQAALAEERAAVAASHERARELENQRAAELAALHDERDVLRRQARKGLLEEAQQARAAIRQALEAGLVAARKARHDADPDAREAAEALAVVQKQAQELEDRVAQDRLSQAAPLQAEPTPGMAVHVPHLNLDGVVLDATSKHVVVAAGSMQVRVARADLRAARRKGAPQGAPARRVTGRGGQADAVPQTLDVRGQRVEDALEALGAFLSRAVGGGLDEVTVVHGHGTGALRQAIRQSLKEHPHVASAARGPDDRGGNGITVVQLKDS